MGPVVLRKPVEVPRPAIALTFLKVERVACAGEALALTLVTKAVAAAFLAA